MAKPDRIPPRFRPWIEARNNFRLSAAQVQMARELGFSPAKLASYGANKNEPWRVPLKEFIAIQYQKQFGKSQPDVIQTMEELAAADVAKGLARKAAKKKKTVQKTVQKTLDAQPNPTSAVPQATE